MSDEAETHSTVKIFISHTHSDSGLTKAFSTLVADLFGQQIEIKNSSSEELKEKPAPGGDWFEWIKLTAIESDLAIVLLSPSSLQSPWVLWESGAITGVRLMKDAYAKEKNNSSNIKPIVYRLGTNEIPAPFSTIQCVFGDNYSSMSNLMDNLYQIVSSKLENNKFQQITRNYYSKVKDSITSYLVEIESVLLHAPLQPTDGTISEWLNRFDELNRQKRYSEVPQYHKWLTIAFGTTQQGIERPIDVRLHRLIGEMYLQAGYYSEAIQQLELARGISPRDIFVLRKLGQAYLKCDKYVETEKIIGRLTILDSSLFINSPEAAAMKGKMKIKQKLYRDAIETYAQAYAANKESYYLGDLLAQAHIMDNNMPEARRIYSDVIDTIEKLNESSIWVYATLSDAYIALEEYDKLKYSIGKIIEKQPARSELEAIRDGFALISSRSSITLDKVEQLLVAQ